MNRSGPLVVGLCALVTACVPGASADLTPVDRLAVESEIFGAVVQDIQRRGLGSEMVMLVDPRPIALRDYRFPGPADYHDGMEPLIAERAAMLADQGVDTTSAFPILTGCDGILSAPPGVRAAHGCPAVTTIIILMDTARAGTDPGTWIMRRMLIAYLAQWGRSGGTTDYMVGRRDGEWAVLERREVDRFEH